jgi:hypothetical protein
MEVFRVYLQGGNYIDVKAKSISPSTSTVRLQAEEEETVAIFAYDQITGIVKLKEVVAAEESSGVKF